MWSNSLIQLKLKPDSYEFGFFMIDSDGELGIRTLRPEIHC
jgi:hypothetical protein